MDIQTRDRASPDVAPGLVRLSLPDAIGPVLRRRSYRLFRESPAGPGPHTCTQRRFDRICTGVGFNPR